MKLDCSEILPERLWVGTYLGVEEVARLEELRITTVVSLQDENDIVQRGISVGNLATAYAHAGIEFRQAPVPDFDKRELLAKLPDCVAEIAAALKPQNARVYLHCTMGMNRAPTAAAAYMMRSRGISARVAYDHMVSRRYCRPYLDVLEDYAALMKDDPPA
jgi:protein-tyrosine phosphatase